MKIQCFMMFFVLCFSLKSLATRPVIQSKNMYTVFSYGAKGDGKTDDTQAFLKAWADVCGANGSFAALSVPCGHSFLLQPLVFEGPCNANSIHFELMGSIVAPDRSIWKGDNKKAWIQFSNIKGLIIDGKDTGTIDGKGSSWWENEDQSLDPEKVQSTNDAGSRPTALYIHGCDELSILQTKHIDSPRNHMTINGCNGVEIKDLHIVAPEESPNTDGINISQSTNVNVKNSVIETGDDCIAISNATSNINISGIMCGPGHGISIGSLGQNGQYQTVEQVHVTNCTFNGTQNGARIKTWEGGSGYARNISFERIHFENARHPIIIDQFYTSKPNSQNSAVFISDIKFSHMEGTSASEEAIALNCSDEKGCVNIQMDHINIVGSSEVEKTDSVTVYSTCHNAHGTSSYVTPDVPCLGH